MNQKLQKIIDEIEKTKAKISNYTVRLRELERQKTELENADIVALVRGIDILPDEFAAFVRAYKEQGVPSIENIDEKREESILEN